ncbi:SRPBCC family protein, partial [Frankia nepalensis]|uniref:SRPBCC family protein n=1 Tax=Frankia nepalensis TaxID=1836974 RepID=UPI001931C543
MELVNEFRVGLPVETAWALLTDLERIAPCMPGAQLLSVEGEEYHGAVKVKVGPITAQYKGKATFQEVDENTHRAVIKADGRESRGQGNASALVTAQLTPDGDGTAVRLATDLTISGKAAQFGRGVLADVSGKLVAQFVRNLEADVAAAAAAASAGPAATATEAESGPPAASAPGAAAPGDEAPSGKATTTEAAPRAVPAAAPADPGAEAAPTSPVGP